MILPSHCFVYAVVASTPTIHKKLNLSETGLNLFFKGLKKCDIVYVMNIHTSIKMIRSVINYKKN